MLTGIICNDFSCHIFTSYEWALDSKLNGYLRSRLSVMNGHLRSLTHLAEIIIAIFWYKIVFQTTASLDMVNIPCFEIHINQNSVYGQFWHEFIQYWFALIIFLIGDIV